MARDAGNVERNELDEVVLPTVGDTSGLPFDQICAAKFVHGGDEHATPLVRASVDVESDEIQPALGRRDRLLLERSSAGDGVHVRRSTAL